MDLDSFITSHSQQWTRLDGLSRRRRLSGAEADELVALYREVATHLALVQSRVPEPVLAARLSRLLARARTTAVGTPQVSGWAAVLRGMTVDFPVTVYRTWRWSVGVAVVSVATMASMMLYLRAHPHRLGTVLTTSADRNLVNHQFRSYYSDHPAHAFAAQVWTNNALVSALALFLGVTLIGTLAVLFSNVVNVGLVGGAMVAAGRSGEFFGLILPHGMLELSAVFVAGGVGLRTGWAWVSPGPLPRAQALAEAGRAAAMTAIGLTGVLFVSGVIEAFVTPSGLPTWARIGVGAVAELGFLSYVIVLGRRGVRLGATGDLGRAERGDTLPVAA